MRFLFTALCALLIPHALLAQTPPPPRSAGAAGAMVDAFRAGDAARVRQMGASAGAVGVRWATWTLLRAGDVTDFATYQNFVLAHPHWPNIDQIRRQAEARIADQPPATVLAWFLGQPPQTTEGALAWLRALSATGQDPSPALRFLWLDAPLSAAQEQALLAEHAAALAPLHIARADALLWRGEPEAAERLLALLPDDHRRLARARIGLQARVDGVDALVDAVPTALASDPGLAHDRFRWRLAAGLTDEAAALMADLADTALGQPQAWAGQRARLTRRALDAGDAALAYRLAANHGLTEGGAMADLEWLAGYIALRHLNRATDAVTHFQRLRERVSSPISLGRAGYWEGRAQDALGNADAARAAYEFGAQHQTSYYGQLAAERLGQPLDPALIADPRYPEWHQTSLAQSDLLQTALMLMSKGDFYESRRFTLHLAETLTLPDELGALAQLWMDRGQMNLALRIAKIAIDKGILLPRAYFPLHPGLTQAQLPVATDLALAIARRESEFDHRVISHADARGLMQVLPETGRAVARRLGIEFDKSRMTSDPAFNATLGAGYLAQLAQEFDGTLSLMAAGYNAGPGRPRRWVTEFGDPRNAGTDPIDWVETIPFTETRNYVMRVTESVIIYRAILAGRSGPIGLTDMLRGRN